MEKGFRNNKIEVIIVTLLSIILLTELNTYASCREFELFDQGYEYYLSNNPLKAEETFKIFLKEFPDSSAKDAAMFWLGKSLMQLKSFEEAKKVFSEIKQQFPESPFIRYVNLEFEAKTRAEAKTDKTQAGVSDALTSAPGSKQKGTSIYSVQIGLFKNEANAAAFEKKYKERGYNAFIHKSTAKDNRMLYRVLIGRYENMKEAAELAKSIRDKEKIDVIIFYF